MPFLNKKVGRNEILSLKKVIFLLIHPENSAMIGKVALFLDVYPDINVKHIDLDFLKVRTLK